MIQEHLRSSKSLRPTSTITKVVLKRGSTSRRRRSQHLLYPPTVMMIIMMMMLLSLLSLVSWNNNVATMMVSAKSPSLLPKTRQRQPTLVDRPPNAKTTTTSTTSTNRGRIRMKKTKTKTTTVPEAPWVSGIKNSIASGLAAGCSKLILAPFDTIKTLQQHSRSFTSVAGTAGAGAAAESSLTLLQAAKSIMNRPRGFLEFYVSMSSPVLSHTDTSQNLFCGTSSVYEFDGCTHSARLDVGERTWMVVL